MFLYSVKEDAG